MSRHPRSPRGLARRTAEAARRLGVSRERVRQLLEQGMLRDFASKAASFEEGEHGYVMLLHLRDVSVEPAPPESE
jgi:hypothetical protein